MVNTLLISFRWSRLAGLDFCVFVLATLGLLISVGKAFHLKSSWIQDDCLARKRILEEERHKKSKWQQNTSFTHNCTYIRVYVCAFFRGTDTPVFLTWQNKEHMSSQLCAVLEQAIRSFTTSPCIGLRCQPYKGFQYTWRMCTRTTRD